MAAAGSHHFKNETQNFSNILLEMDALYQKIAATDTIPSDIKARLEQLGQEALALFPHVDSQKEKTSLLPMMRWLSETERYPEFYKVVMRLTPQNGTLYYIGHSTLAELFFHHKLVKDRQTKNVHLPRTPSEVSFDSFMIQQRAALTHALKAGDYLPNLKNYLQNAVGIQFQFLDKPLFSTPGINAKTFIDGLLTIRAYNIARQCINLQISLDSNPPHDIERQLVLLETLLHQTPVPHENIRQLMLEITLEEDQSLFEHPKLDTTTIVDILQIASKRGLDLEFHFAKVQQNIDKRDENGNTYLLRATQMNATGLLRRCISCGASIEAQNYQGETASQLTQKHYHPQARFVLTAAQTFFNIMNGKITQTVTNDTLEKLLHEGASVGQRDSNQWTPLHWAAFTGNVQYIDFLIHHKADIRARTKDNENSLDIALKSENYEAALFLQVQYLIEADRTLSPSSSVSMGSKNATREANIQKALELSKIVDPNVAITALTQLTQFLYQKNKLADAYAVLSALPKKQQESLPTELSGLLTHSIILKQDEQAAFVRKTAKKPSTTKRETLLTRYTGKSASQKDQLHTLRPELSKQHKSKRKS